MRRKPFERTSISIWIEQMTTTQTDVHKLFQASTVFMEVKKTNTSTLSNDFRKHDVFFNKHGN